MKVRSQRLSGGGGPRGMCRQPQRARSVETAWPRGGAARRAACVLVLHAHAFLLCAATAPAAGDSACMGAAPTACVPRPCTPPYRADSAARAGAGFVPPAVGGVLGVDSLRASRQQPLRFGAPAASRGSSSGSAVGLCMQQVHRETRMHATGASGGRGPAGRCPASCCSIWAHSPCHPAGSPQAQHAADRRAAARDRARGAAKNR